MTKGNAPLPRNIRWEMARLAQFTPIISETISYAENSSGPAVIRFDIETDLQLEPTDTPILDIEPVLFEYRNSTLIGKIAPRVLSGRKDFPRDLQHINPGSRDQPVSLCVSRAGHQAIYDAAGVVGIAHRTMSWLNDAKCESLYEDGWDPVPLDTMDGGVIGYYNAKALQSHAASKPDGGYAFSTAKLTFNKSGLPFVHVGSDLIDLENTDEIYTAKKAMTGNNKDASGFHTSVPTVFCWPARSNTQTVPHFHEWVDMDVLIEGLKATKLHIHVDTAFLMLDPLFGENLDLGLHRHKVILLIVGLWRPVPLDPTIVGLATDSDARHLELRPFYLERDHGVSDRWSKATLVRPFFGLVPEFPETLEAVSGEPALGYTALLGAGALGSALLAHAVRGGADQVTVIDNDILLSHNMARHRASRFHIGKNKAELSVDLAMEWTLGARITPLTTDITMLTNEQLAMVFKDCEGVWDTTANPLVRRRLSGLENPALPVVRSEIYHQGRLGVTLLTSIGARPNLNNLFHQLIATAMDDDWVKEWLRYEESRSFLDEELLLGFGCRSLTTKMPAYKVDSHAATAFALAKHHSAESAARIALHRINDIGVSEGTKVFDAEEVSVFADMTTTNGWTVFVSKSVIDQLHALRKTKAPKETGGYLFGAIDEDLSQIHVVAASPEPPGTIASATALELGPWGRTGHEQAFMRRTRGRLPPIGTWHSHPSSPPIASVTDRKTVESFKLEDAAKGLPTIMAITGNNADEFYVLEA